MWEFSNKLKWFDEKTIEKINKGQFDFGKEFKEKDS